MSTITVEELRTTTSTASLLDRHPRGRGFGILSRMAKVEDVTGQHVRADEVVEAVEAVEATEATVIPFDRNRHETQYQGRHRRDDSTLVHLG